MKDMEVGDYNPQGKKIVPSLKDKTKQELEWTKHFNLALKTQQVSLTGSISRTYSFFLEGGGTEQDLCKQCKFLGSRGESNLNHLVGVHLKRKITFDLSTLLLGLPLAYTSLFSP